MMTVLNSSQFLVEFYTNNFVSEKQIFRDVKRDYFAGLFKHNNKCKIFTTLEKKRTKYEGAVLGVSQKLQKVRLIGCSSH